MSTRPTVFAPTDLVPLRDAILSGEERYVDAAITALRDRSPGRSPERLAEFEADWRPEFRQLVFGESLTGGVSGGAVEYLAAGLGIIKGDSLLTDWKLWAWFDYEAGVEEAIGEAAELLNYLCEGRPFPEKADGTEGAYFAWLEAAEVKVLRAGLRAVDPATLVDELTEFHAELCAALDQATDGLLLFGW